MVVSAITVPVDRVMPPIVTLPVPTMPVKWSSVPTLTLAEVAIFMALAAVTGGVGAAGAVFKPDTTSMATYFTPITLIYLVFSALLWPLGLTLLVGPSASIYQSLTADPSEVF